DPGLAWLRWASPIGWIEELRPLTGSKPLAFIPVVALVVMLVALSVWIAARRDVGAGAFAIGETPKPRTRLLGSQAGLTLRLTRPTVVAWTAALVATGLVFGLVAQAAGSALRGIGGSGSGAASYLGFVFVIAAGLMAIAVAGQIASIRNEEASRHLDHLFVRPVERWRWLTVRLGVGLGLVALAGLLAGVAAWVGAASQHADVGLGELVKAGL